MVILKKFQNIEFKQIYIIKIVFFFTSFILGEK